MNLFLPLRARNRPLGDTGVDTEEDNVSTIMGDDDGAIYLEEAVAVLEGDLGVLVSDGERTSFARQFRVARVQGDEDELRRSMVDATQMLRCFGFWEGNRLSSIAHGGIVSSSSSNMNCTREEMKQT